LIIFYLYAANSAVATGGGWSTIIAQAPTQTGWETVGNPVLWVVGLTFASWITIGLYASDYFRFAKKFWHVPVAGGFAYLCGKTLLQILGAITAKGTGQADVTQVLVAIGALGMAFFVFTFANWTSTTTQLYSSSIALTNIIRTRRVLTTIIVGVIAIIIAAAGIYNYLLHWFLFLGIFVGPLLGPIYADYYVSRKWIIRKDYSKPQSEKQILRPSGVIGWLAGVGGGYLMQKAGWGLIGLNGIAIGFGVYLLVEWITLKVRVGANQT
jgi:cytosine permease